MTPTIRQRAFLLCSALLCIQFWLTVATDQPNKLVGDEPFYVGRAATFREQGLLIKAGADHLDTVAGKSIGQTSDFRAPGYPILLAVAGITPDNHAQTRLRISLLQCGAMAVALLILLGRVLAERPAGGAALATAVVLSLQPWTFAYTRSLTPDSLAASLFLLGILLFLPSVDASPGGERRFRLVACGVLLGLSAFMRVELFLLAPLPLLAAALLKDRTPLAVLRRVGLPLAVFLMFFGANGLLRWHFDGTVFPRFVTMVPGLTRWTGTWLNTEKERYNLIWGFAAAKASFDDLPTRAFGDDWERDAIQRAFMLRDAGGQYTREIDSLFLEVAERRARDRPFCQNLLPRIVNTGQLLVNLETNNALLSALKQVPATFRKPLLGGLFGVKLALVAMALASCVLFFKGQHWRTPGRAELLWVVSCTVVLARLLSIAVVLGKSESRYALMTWPFVFWCAFCLYLWWSPAGAPLPKDFKTIKQTVPRHCP